MLIVCTGEAIKSVSLQPIPLSVVECHFFILYNKELVTKINTLTCWIMNLPSSPVFHSGMKYGCQSVVTLLCASPGSLGFTV